MERTMPNIHLALFWKTSERIFFSIQTIRFKLYQNLGQLISKLSSENTPFLRVSASPACCRVARGFE